MMAGAERGAERANESARMQDCEGQPAEAARARRQAGTTSNWIWICPRRMTDSHELPKKVSQ
jgi:hypothetical protein